jgi:predicted nucleic acid-binding protein
MGVTLAAGIPDGATVLIDTNPIVYWLQGNELGAPIESVFADVEAGRIGCFALLTRDRDFSRVSDVSIMGAE